MHNVMLSHKQFICQSRSSYTCTHVSIYYVHVHVHVCNTAQFLHTAPLQGVLDRFSQIKPKVIFSVEAVRYNNKVHDHLGKLKAVVDGLPELRRVVLFPFCGTQDINTADIPNW